METQKEIDNFIVFLSCLHHFGTDCKIDKKSKEYYLLLLNKITNIVSNCKEIKTGCENCLYNKDKICTYKDFNRTIPDNVINTGCKFIKIKE